MILFYSNKIGHKNIRDASKYMHVEGALFQSQSDELYSAMNQAVENAKKLIEATSNTSQPFKTL